MARPFFFAGGAAWARKEGMKRQLLRFGIAGLVVVVTAIAGLMAFRGYEKNPDVGALFQTQAVQLKPDRSYVWLNIHVKRSGGQQHDLMKPVRLLMENGEAREPDNMDFAGNPQEGFTDIWYSFWMEQHELKGKLGLKINDGVLKIKETEPVPDLSDGRVRVFKTSKWKKSWLGF